MGRNFYGDIEGKFWFAIQPSDVGTMFGAREANPNVIDYEFEEPEIAKEKIQEIENRLGKEKIEKMDKFFIDNSYYNDEELLKETGASKKDLEDYANLDFGKMLLKAYEDNENCTIYYTAEC